MTFFQLKCFLTVAETLSYTEASNLLFMAQSSLSRNIFNLEEELGLQLFARTKKYVRLTPAGAVLVDRFKKIISDTDDAIETAKSVQSNLEGNLRIGIMDGQMMHGIVPKSINSLCQDLPNLKVILRKCNFKELRRGLESNDLDIVITTDFEVPSYENLEIVSQPFITSKGSCIISALNPLAKKEFPKVEDLAGMPLVALAPDISNKAYEHIIALCNKHGFSPTDIHFSQSTEDTILMVESNMGFSILDENATTMRNPAIRAFPIDDEGDFVSLYAVWKKANMNPTISLFVNSLMDINEK